MTTSHTPTHTSAPPGGTPPIPVTHWEELFAAGCSFHRADDKELHLLADHVLPTVGQQALDVGCGLGGYAAGLAGLGYTTLAVDWAQFSVAAVRDRYSGLEPRLSAFCLDFEDDEAVTRALPTASFDLITMRLVLAFMTDKTAIARRVHRLLTPGGAWVITTPMAERQSADRRRIAVTAQDLAVVTGHFERGSWYDLEPGGIRCIVMRR
ncbi:class I SAM-dependent methyltransferase [Streptomyces sp. NPDC059697]|uniref:class I SAM-dependent methyltransferase n=1 Tax=Streptomyces sp. NPDC059697 TaxID=3346912 RepID=UPI00369E44CA